MNILKKIAGLATATVLATGLIAGTASAADAKPRPGNGGVVTYDTGWP